MCIYKSLCVYTLACTIIYVKNKMFLAPVNRFMKTTKSVPPTSPKPSVASDMQGM